MTRLSRISTIAVFLFGLIMFAAGAGTAAAPGAAAAAEVKMDNFSFMPASITVTVGA